MEIVALFSAQDEHGGLLMARITREADSGYPPGGDGYRYSASLTTDFLTWRGIEGLFGWDRKSVEDPLKGSGYPTFEEISDLGHFSFYTRAKGGVLEVSAIRPEVGDRMVPAKDIPPTAVLSEEAANFFRMFRGEAAVQQRSGLLGYVLVA